MIEDKTIINKPFHPQGMARTQGGVVIRDEAVILLDPQTGFELDRRGMLAPHYRDLYVGRRLFDLFKNNGWWYVARPWTEQVALFINEDSEARVSGDVVYPDEVTMSWEATRHYGERITWDIQVDLPPDHLFEGDIALQIGLGQVIQRLLVMPEYRRTGKCVAPVTNVFADLPAELPFRVNRMGNSPRQHLEVTYGWLW